MKAKDFGEHIKKLRKQANMTIRQLELYSGVSNAYLSQLENGKRGIPSPDIIRKIAMPLRTTYEELMMLAGYLSTSHLNEDSDELSLTPEELAAIERIKNDPEAQIAFKDFLSAPIKKQRSMLKAWEAFKNMDDN